MQQDYKSADLQRARFPPARCCGPGRASSDLDLERLEDRIEGELDVSSAPMNAEYEAESIEVRALAALDSARKRLGPDAPEPKAADEASSPCDGWFNAAILAFELADGARDDERFFSWFELGQSYVVMGQACLETQNTL
jgi:hypothetical protein